MSVLTNAHIDGLIAQDCPVAIGVSGGKDSQAAAIATILHLDRVGHQGPRILVHADLGSVEWHHSLTICQELAQSLDIALIVVSRKAGGMIERWESRWQSSVHRYQTLSTVTLVLPWSTPSMRFCTSELKTHVITAELKRRFAGPIINVTGVRRQESRARASATVSDAKDRIHTWRPILDWSSEQVFAAIDASGLRPHPAYRVFGLSRVSCRFCIMQNQADQIAAAAQPETHDIYRRMVALEADSSFAFQGARWLGDVAPQLLGQDLAARLQHAKDIADKRAAAERQLSRDMLYVKGWPTRMLSDGEADTLAGVRREVSALLGFDSQFLDRESIHARYAGLLEDKARRLPAEAEVAA